MTFTSLKNEKLKISLSGDETLRFFGGADNIDQSDPSTRLMIKLLFKRALSSCSFKPGGGSLTVEVVKTGLGGCDIYFTKVRKDASEHFDLVVFEFFEIENAIKASRALATSEKIVKSRFFRTCDGYRLAVWFSRGFDSAISEFADKTYRGAFGLAKTEEHGREIICENAVDILSKL